MDLYHYLTCKISLTFEAYRRARARSRASSTHDGAVLDSRVEFLIDVQHGVAYGGVDADTVRLRFTSQVQLNAG